MNRKKYMAKLTLPCKAQTNSTMCFYEHYLFACGDWKWGHFRQHCNREYRTGETCGMKLVSQTVGLRESCKLCAKIDTKLRKRAFEVTRIERWYKEQGTSKRSASIEKSYELIKTLDDQIRALDMEKQQRRTAIGGKR